MEEQLQLITRLGCATLFGAVLGLNRGLRQKPAGMRTHALVALGSAFAAWMAIRLSGGDHVAVSRVMQGAITGIGFIGAGVIMHDEQKGQVAGLTTAASVWVATILGLGCGAGLILDTAIALLIALLLLLISGNMQERMAEALNARRRRRRDQRLHGRQEPRERGAPRQPPPGPPA
ncbi:MAG: putative Mg(2+) transport ATPase [Moraxellaceae bacterium]|jgi:putative Mg2+ transporter-C (MgtC) family protein|nr:putative Mg(2+) transport ATPase [Moraxellaceae bacterium]